MHPCTMHGESFLSWYHFVRLLTDFNQVHTIIKGGQESDLRFTNKPIRSRNLSTSSISEDILILIKKCHLSTHGSWKKRVHIFTFSIVSRVITFDWMHICQCVINYTCWFPQVWLQHSTSQSSTNALLVNEMPYSECGNHRNNYMCRINTNKRKW